ncbi:LapA family protein [Rhabdothermincola salaria]|uniref:LapA family protein n=1 Tax=Rhabdothermincola salaria TaxID=2903142 RepID=UPI001E5160BB|nr:lipopolysaccharide assembly protein LapA domain-containing protein [Rhabdothermincola salaria]MCD9624182.1 lipopolysaccharide assembly protein LapA domain-containing protein [Rhabdothermincola salaria]
MADQTHEHGPPKSSLPVGAGGITLIVAIVLLLVFMLQNTKSVTIDFLLWSFTSPLWGVILGSAIVGAAAWLGFGAIRQHRKTSKAT